MDLPAPKPSSRADGLRTLRRRLSRHSQTVDLMLDDVAKQLPALTPEQLQQLGQSFFARLALSDQDTMAWVKIQFLELHRQQFQFAQYKFQITLQSKIQAGKQAIGEHFQNHPEAKALYERACALLPNPPKLHCYEPERTEPEPPAQPNAPAPPAPTG